MSAAEPSRRSGPGRIGLDGGLLFDSAGSRSLEGAAAAGLQPHALMERAGLAVARLAAAVAPHARRISVLAGPGNNGGDGFEAAARLQAAGRQVEVQWLGDEQRMPDDARASLQRARQAGVRIHTGLVEASDADLAIDALLGLGSRRPLEGALAQAVRRLRAAELPVLAVDVPTGLNSDTGAVLGELAVQAHHTLSLLALQPGLFTAQGRDHAGSVWHDDLGVAPVAARAVARLASTDDLRSSHAPRRHAQHKGSFGDVLVVGGAPSMAGAAVLAAGAALTAGAGRVYLSLLDETLPLLQLAAPDLMCRARAWTDTALVARATVVCGCGGGQAVAAVLPALLSRAARLVLDADALNAVAADENLQALLRGRGPSRPALLTPHPLEAARLLGCGAAEVQADRLAAARALSDRFGATVLLKGSGSIVAAPGLLPTLNPSGNALLASAGTGDVLAGWTGGLWSQAAEATWGSAAEAGVAAAFLHGAAADLAAGQGQRVPLRASNLARAMSAALPALLAAPFSRGS